MANGKMKRVCLLTGAGGRLGSEICNRLRNRFEIVAVHRSTPPQVPSQNQRFIDPLRPQDVLEENESPVFSIKADLTSAAEQDRVTELVAARFGVVDSLINAAVYSRWGSMLNDDRLLDSAMHQFATNVVMPLSFSVKVARRFWRDSDQDNRSRNRNIVNISSIAGCSVYPNLGQSVYAASKAALNHLTKHMASEFATLGIRVNALAPNSFPEIVPIDTVIQKIAEIDDGKETGTIFVIDNFAK